MLSKQLYLSNRIIKYTYSRPCQSMLFLLVAHGKLFCFGGLNLADLENSYFCNMRKDGITIMSSDGKKSTTHFTSYERLNELREELRKEKESDQKATASKVPSPDSLKADTRLDKIIEILTANFEETTVINQENKESNNKAMTISVAACVFSALSLSSSIWLPLLSNPTKLIITVGSVIILGMIVLLPLRKRKKLQK